MKVQLDAQALRWRIDEAELAQLQAGGQVRLAPAAGALGVSFALGVIEAAAAELVVDGTSWILHLPAAGLHDYVATLPCRDAWALEAALHGDAARVRIRFEVDVRDSVRSGRVRRRGDATTRQMRDD